MMGKAPIPGLDLESWLANGDRILLLSAADVANVGIRIGGRSCCYKAKDDILGQGIGNGLTSRPQQQKREAPNRKFQCLDEVHLF